MNKETKYYLIWDSIVGKCEEGIDYIFKNGEWYLDNENIIFDRLIGYDPTEPPGSPYAYGNGSVLAEMTKIPFEKAYKLTGGIA